MLIAKRPRPRAALLQRTLVLLGAGLLAGCQGTDQAPPTPAAVAAAAHWQVVERLGDARWRGADGGIWTPAMPSGTLPAGSEVTTGRGGRLIAARAGTHISVGPDSRFSLPDGAPDAALAQDAGRLRYRIAAVAAQPLVVATRFLEISPEVAVFDVTVTPAATEVAVERGSVRIATPDGMRQIELGAGQSAYAGAGADQALTFRRAPGEPAEPVAPLVVPAMNPPVAVAEGRAVVVAGAVAITSSQASTSGAVASQAAALVAPADVAAAVAARGASESEMVALPALAPAVARGKPAVASGQGVILQVGMVRRDPPAPPPLTNDAPARDPGPGPAPAGSLPQAAAAPQPAEPLTAEPVAAQPPATEPMTIEPPAIEPPAAEPMAGEPVVAEPAAEEPGKAVVEDRSSAFDRLTDGMVDGVAMPRDPAAPAAKTSSF